MIITWSRRIAFIVVALACGVASADGWEISVGANYRSVGKLELDRIKFVNPTYGGDYVNGSVATNSIVVDQWIKQTPGLSSSTARLNSLSGRVGECLLDNEPGAILELSKALSQQDYGVWSLDLSMSWTKSDLSENSNFSGTPAYRESDGLLGFLGNGTPNGATAVGPNDVPVAVVDGVDVTGNLDYDMDIAVYTFGLGVGLSHEVGICALKLSAGPTATLVDYSIDVTQSATWNDDGTAVYASQKSSDDDLVLDAGAYVGLTLGVGVTEAIGVAVGVRYDHSFTHVGTDFGDIELQGLSGELKLTYSF